MRITTLNETLGYYTPGFFELYIATVNPIDINKLTPRELCTFIHEYTHFLQDFTTIKGLENIFTIFEWLRLFVTETYKNRKIEIPTTFTHKVISAATEVKNKSWGTIPNNALSSIVNLSDICLHQSLPKTLIKDYPELSSFRVVKANAKLSNGISSDIEIGTLAVMESMSHLSEGLMKLPVTNSPDYPYNSIRLLADAICPSKQLNDEVLFALCDVALQCSVPGKAIYEMLSGIQSAKYSYPTDGYDVYNYFQDAFKPWSDTSASSIICIAKDHLRELVKGPIGERFQAWINNIFDFAIYMRQNNPSFFIDMFRTCNKYSDIVNKIGTPLMVNAIKNYSKIPVSFPLPFISDMDVEFFRAVSYVIDMYITGSKECPMQDWCNNSHINTDNNCITDPPARSDNAKYSHLCPVGALWRSWNLSRYRLNKECLYRKICK